MLIPIISGYTSTPLTVTYIGASVDSASPYSFSSQGIGTAAADRWVVVCACHEVVDDDPSVSISGVTCGGVSMTEVVKKDHTEGGIPPTNSSTGIWMLKVTTGTTADIVVSSGSATGSVRIAVYNVNGSLYSTTATDTISTSFNPNGSAAIDFKKNGAVIAIAMKDASNGTTWTNLTENYDAGKVTTASTAPTSDSTTNVGVSTSTNYTVLVAASWRAE